MKCYETALMDEYHANVAEQEKQGNQFFGVEVPTSSADQRSQTREVVIYQQNRVLAHVVYKHLKSLRGLAHPLNSSPCRLVAEYTGLEFEVASVHVEQRTHQRDSFGSFQFDPIFKAFLERHHMMVSTPWYHRGQIRRSSFDIPDPSIQRTPDVDNVGQKCNC